MGRWTQYDEPEYRTGGMKRVGYDADEQCYFYRDTDGSLWRSAPGVEYGHLTRVHESSKGHTSASSIDSTSSATTPSMSKNLKFEYQDDGALYIGPDGAAKDKDLEAEASEEERMLSPKDDLHDVTRRSSARRMRPLLPFFLIICAILLLVIRIFSPTMVRSPPPPCPQHSRHYEIKSGDTCWAIAKDYGTTVESLRSFNPTLECLSLVPGQDICVPVKD